MKISFDILRDPLLKGVDIDSPERFQSHQKMLEKKRMLRDVFIEFHNLFRKLEYSFLSGEGLEVEIGAGVIIFSENKVTPVGVLLPPPPPPPPVPPPGQRS
jgi:hypothetical protein